MHLARFTLILASALAATHAASAADTVRLMPSVRIAPGAEFTLADIADLDGEAAETLAGTRIGRGESGAFELSLDRVRQQLVVAGADVRKVAFEGTKTIVRPLRGAAVAGGVAKDEPRTAGKDGTARTRLVDPAREAGTGSALAIICELVRNAFGNDACGLQLEIAEDQLARIAPKPGFRYEVARKSTLRSARVEVEVIARDPAGEETRTRVRITPRFEREVLVARADVRRGDRADGDATNVETRMLGYDELKDAAAPADANGAVFAHAVPRGEIVERGDVARNSEIHRRDKVTVRREVGMVAIEFEAVALEDGAVGDVIALERADRRNARESRPLSAEVVGPGRVVIR